MGCWFNWEGSFAGAKPKGWANRLYACFYSNDSKYLKNVVFHLWSNLWPWLATLGTRTKWSLESRSIFSQFLVTPKTLQNHWRTDRNIFLRFVNLCYRCQNASDCPAHQAAISVHLLVKYNNIFLWETIGFSFKDLLAMVTRIYRSNDIVQEYPAHMQRNW